MQNSTRVSNRIVVFILLFFLIVFASACQMRQKGRKPSPDWSRGLPVGVFVRGDVDLVVEPDGSLTHFVWLTEDDAEQSLVQYMALDETAVIQIDHPLDILATQIRHPRLILNNNDSIHLLWSTREENERGWDLWYSQLDETGNFKGEHTRLATAEDKVMDYDVVSDDTGGLFVVWENGTDGMVAGAQISADGKILQSVPELATGGSPSIQIDDGTLHMTWLSGNDVAYAQWLDGELATAVPTTITTFPESTSGRLDGPELGVAGDWAYIFWSFYYSSGLEAGTAVAEYAAFPLDNPQITNPIQIRSRPDEEQVYEPYQGAYNLTQLAPPADVRGSTSFVREPRPTTSRGDELAVALTMSQDFRLNAFIQTATAIFKNGEYMGYQLAGKTEAFSQNPILATDDNGDLYMAWRDGGRGTLVYYALTTQIGQAALNQMGVNDFANVAMNGGVEVVAGMLFFPLACVWFVPGFLIIGLYHFWKGESDLKDPVTIILLVISIVVSQGMKFLFLPTMMTYVPFSAWVDIPTGWESGLVLLVPTVTAVIGLLVAWFMHKRTDSGLAFFFWFTATDALLTLAIYGVNFLGVF